MSLSIGDALLKVGVDKTDFDKGMSSLKDSAQKHAKEIGLAMTAAGAAIVGALAMSAKAAAEEEAGIQRLSVAMENVGLSYDSTRESLEKWINAQQQSTAFADDQQRQSLSQLIILTGNMTEAQNLLSTAMDVARWKNIDLMTASDLLMKVYAGDMGMLKRYGIIVSDNATAVEALAEIQQKAAGQAEEYGKTTAGQMELLKNNIGDLKEAIGDVLLPALQDLFGWLNSTMENIKAWTAENPELLGTIVKVTGAVGGLLLIGGTLSLILPKIIAGFTALTGAIKALGAGLIPLLTNPTFLAIAGAAVAVWGFYNIFKEINREANEEAERAKRNLEAYKNKIKELTDIIKAELDKQLAAYLKTIDEERQAAQEAHDEAIALIREEYGMLEDYAQDTHRTKMQIAVDESNARIQEMQEAINSAAQVRDEQIAAAQAAANAEIANLESRQQFYRDMTYERMDLIDQQMLAEIAAVDSVLAAQLEGINSEIEALDDRAAERQHLAEEERLEELQRQLEKDDLTDQERFRIKQEIEAIEDSWKRRELIDEWHQKVSELNMDDYFEAKAEKRQADLDAEIQSYEEQYNQRANWLKFQQDLEAFFLQFRLQQIEDERLEVEDAEKQKYNALVGRLANEEQKIKEYHARMIEEEKLYQESLAMLRGEGMPSLANPPPGGTTIGPSANIPGFQGGGLITRPTLAMLGERYVPEIVMPLDKFKGMASNTINQTFQVSAVIREESDIKKVAKELFNLQQRGLRSAGIV